MVTMVTKSVMQLTDVVCESKKLPEALLRLQCGLCCTVCYKQSCSHTVLAFIYKSILHDYT